MEKLYVVKNGIYKVGYQRSKDGKQIKNGEYYLITRNFISNTGYIGKRSDDWRLYTSVGSTENMKSRYHHFASFEECLNKLQELYTTGTVEVIDIDTYKTVFASSSNDKDLDKYSTNKLLLWFSNYYNAQNINFEARAKNKLRSLIDTIYQNDQMCEKYQSNDRLLDQIAANHLARLEKLKALYEAELLTIRLEDIPNVD